MLGSLWTLGTGEQKHKISTGQRDRETAQPSGTDDEHQNVLDEGTHGNGRECAG